jgi:hypothetical protein
MSLIEDISANFLTHATLDVRKPLYSLTAGDLGCYSNLLSENLTRIFSLCARWDAIILLDEADIFLEARSTREIDRNAMVSVFLKELE